MKLCLKIFVVAIVAAFTYSLIGCAAPAGFSYQNVSISLNEYCTYSCSQVTYDPNQPGVWEIGQIEYFFTATVQNAPPNYTWALYPTENLSEPGYPTCTGSGCLPGETSAGPTDGYFNAGPNNSGNTVIYWPTGAPIFSGAALQQAENFQYTISYTQQSLSVNGTPSIQTITKAATGIPMGDILLAVSVPSSATNPSQTYTYYQLMEITGSTPSPYLIPSDPTTPSGLTNSVVTVPHGTSFQFFGGAVGGGPCSTATSCALQASGYQSINSIDNTVVWEVGSSTSTVVIGGISGTGSYGTVSTSGLYTAPTVSPTGTFPFTAVLVMAPHLALTTTKTAYITVN
jgi:hypothetical protein